MDKQLLILPFDHRASFARDILKAQKVGRSEIRQIKVLKEIIFAAFLQARKKFPLIQEQLGILVDEEYGTAILRQAKKNNILFTMPTEKSGQVQYQFEFGASFGQHIKKFAPTYVKALVRYNPANTKINQAQLKTLKRLSVFCKKNKFKLLLELLVPPTEKDIAICKNKEKYDVTRRFELTVKAVQEMNKVLKVDIWKLEGFNETKQYEKLTKVGAPGKIIILGRAQTAQALTKWLEAGGRLKSVIGFAIGRSIFEAPLKLYVAGKLDKVKTTNKIANNYVRYIKLWLKIKSK